LRRVAANLPKLGDDRRHVEAAGNSFDRAILGPRGDRVEIVEEPRRLRVLGGDCSDQQPAPCP
jgi:hypothetical protein